ncbi:MAG: inositol monophosphatase family protein [Pseudomonadota bacterium]
MTARPESDQTPAHRASLDFFNRLIPCLITAGHYALRLQSQLSQQTQTKEGDEWQSALTDADIGVQQYIEAIVLAEFPGWDFFGEEHAATCNTLYFPKGADACIMLDPINGTRLYRDGSPYFDILVSLRWQGRLIATLSYHPALARLYGSSLYAPSFVLYGDQLENIQPLRAIPNADAPLGVYQCPQAMIDALQSVHPLFDFSRDYAPEDPRCALNSMFSGQLAGYLMLDCAVLDVGATAFAVTRLGGTATKPDGSELAALAKFEPEQREDLLVTWSPKLHESLVQNITASGYTVAPS